MPKFQPKTEISWPEGRSFAFTIFDDTDLSTLKNIKPVYSFLEELGFRITKSVWPIRGNQEAKIRGATCEELDYLNWVKTLQDKGFEIGLHSATFHTSQRAQTLSGIKRFHELFGHWPKTIAFHLDNQENLYWGDYRLTGFKRHLYNFLARGKRYNYFRGHIEQDPLFWGDVCKQRIEYVRNFVFGDINTLNKCPFMPYHDPKRPFVNWWFASTEGASVEPFNKSISEPNQDRLEQERGACIMYTHFAKGFFMNGGLDSRFKILMKRLSQKNGWFVPVSTLLDYLKKINGEHIITPLERMQLELNWLMHKFTF